MPIGCNFRYTWWICEALGDERWNVHGMHPPLSFFLSSTLPSMSSPLGRDSTAAYNYAINASSAISTMFSLRPQLYQKWLVQRRPACLRWGGVNGCNWHSGRSWHPWKQLRIKPGFKLGLDYLKINIQCACQIGCSHSSGKLIWTTLAALWANLAGCIIDTNTKPRSQVCVCVSVKPLLSAHSQSLRHYLDSSPPL